MAKNPLLLTLFLLLLSSPCFSQSDKSDTDRNAQNVFDNDSLMEAWLKENHIRTLGLGIIEGGTLRQIKVYGEITEGVPAPYNTLFNVASLAKPITAMVALRLASQGKWDLDETLSNYWIDPDIKNDKRTKKITTRLILSHQTGFPNWRWQNSDNKLKFEFEPGTHYHYSGEGFEYLRKALENKFKQPLEQLAKQLIFEPLGMDDTGFIWNEKLEKSRISVGYDQNGNPYETIKNNKANAADDLYTTIEDYGNFLVSILKNKNLSEDIYRDMLNPQVKTKENKYFGLGFELYEIGNGDYAISHGGSDKGSQCITFLLPKTKQGILIFTNSDTGYKIYNKLLLHYLGNAGKKLIDIETK